MSWTRTSDFIYRLREGRLEQQKVGDEYWLERCDNVSTSCISKGNFTVLNKDGTIINHSEKSVTDIPVPVLPLVRVKSHPDGLLWGQTDSGKLLVYREHVNGRYWQNISLPRKDSVISTFTFGPCNTVWIINMKKEIWFMKNVSSEKPKGSETWYQVSFLLTCDHLKSNLPYLVT